MPYNYFCCRKHAPPVKHAIQQLAGMPNTYASPMCPSCGKTMERYDTGAFPTDPRPVPPPAPGALPVPVVSAAEVEIYSGSGNNPGHGLVTWRISRNAARADMTIVLNLGQNRGGAYDSTQSFKMADGLLDTAQGGNKENWWLNAPMHTGGDKAVWHSFNLQALLGPAGLGTLPASLDIGVKLGNAAFGMIHLLAGHAASVRNVGPHKVFSTGDQRDDVYRTLLSLQSGMKRFETDQINQMFFDATADKLLIRGSHSGLIVVTRRPGSPRFAITTVYNTGAPTFGTKIYER